MKLMLYIFATTLVILSITLSVSARQMTREEALEIFRQRLSKIEEGDARAYLELAEFSFNHGLLDRARSMLNRALIVDPELKEEAELLIKQFKSEKGKGLLSEASSDYDLGYYAEAKIKLDRIISQYPDSDLALRAEQLLNKVHSETRRRPFLLTPLASHQYEFHLIITQLMKRAEAKEKEIEKLKEDYFTDLLKKAEHYAKVMVNERKDYQVNQGYLFYSARCLKWILESDQGPLKVKAAKMEREVINELFKNYSEILSGQRDTYYYLLHRLDDRNLEEKTCKEFFNKGKRYLESADKAGGEEKTERLRRASDYFYIVHDYTTSDELKNEAFSNLKTIKHKLKTLR
jgi:tetratricopeptide (TPR) repeat protein